MTEGSGEAEWRKRITAKLLPGPSVLLIDNLKRPLDSAALSAAITSRTWEDRILGLSKLARCPVRCAWLATGNNPGLSNEMARRTVRIRLDAKLERPWDRDPKVFRNPDLLGWTKEHRGGVVWAVLVLSRAWLVKGRPAGQVSIGMFEDWAHTVGGILQVADISGFLGNRTELYQVSDREGTIWRAFLCSWWDQHGNSSVGVAELFPLAGDLDLGNGNDRSQRTRLGELLRSKQGQQFGQFRLVGAGTRKRALLWKLEPVETSNKAEEHGTGEPVNLVNLFNGRTRRESRPVMPTESAAQTGSPGSPNPEFEPLEMTCHMAG